MNRSITRIEHRARQRRQVNRIKQALRSQQTRMEHVERETVEPDDNALWASIDARRNQLIGLLRNKSVLQLARMLADLTGNTVANLASESKADLIDGILDQDEDLTTLYTKAYNRARATIEKQIYQWTLWKLNDHRNKRLAIPGADFMLTWALKEFNGQAPDEFITAQVKRAIAEFNKWQEDIDGDLCRTLNYYSIKGFAEPQRDGTTLITGVEQWLYHEGEQVSDRKNGTETMGTIIKVGRDAYNGGYILIRWGEPVQEDRAQRANIISDLKIKTLGLLDASIRSLQNAAGSPKSLVKNDLRYALQNIAEAKSACQDLVSALGNQAASNESARAERADITGLFDRAIASLRAAKMAISAMTSDPARAQYSIGDAQAALRYINESMNTCADIGVQL